MHTLFWPNRKIHQIQHCYYCHASTQNVYTLYMVLIIGFTVICMIRKVAFGASWRKRHFVLLANKQRNGNFGHTQKVEKNSENHIRIRLRIRKAKEEIDKLKPSKPQNISILIIHTFTCTRNHKKGTHFLRRTRISITSTALAIFQMNSISLRWFLVRLESIVRGRDFQWH